jgi:uncharacterized protein (DUF2147 family)
MQIMLLTPILAMALQAAAQSSIQGTWRSPGGNSIITIAPCGSALCGTVVWASEKAKQDARKGTGQLIGAQLLTNVVPRGNGWQGRLFIPDQNIRATGKIQMVSAQLIKVSGCALGKALCKSSLWTRFDGPLPASN